MISFKDLNQESIIEAAKAHSFQLYPTIGLNKAYTFGVEIEFENAPLGNIKNIGKWELKKETTISYQENGMMIGGELTSPVLVDDKSVWEDIDAKCKKLIKHSAKVTNSTGGHIHVGSQIIGENPDNIRRFLKMWELFENIIYCFSYGYDSKYRDVLPIHANPIGSRLKMIRTSRRGYDQFKSFYHWIKYFEKIADQKHEGISFKKFRGCEEDINNTIEIRCPNGSLDSIIWQNNVNFFTRLLLKSHEGECDESLIDYLLLKKETLEYDLKTFNQFKVEMVILLSDILFDKENEKLMFLKQTLKLFNEEEKSKNHSL